MGILILKYIPRSGNLLFSFVFFFQLICVAFNNWVNIYVVNRFFPDRLLTSGANRLLIVSLIFDISSLITAIGLIWTALQDNTHTEDGNFQKILTLCICLALFIIIIIYFLIMRLQIKGYLKEAFNIKKMTTDIGKETDY